MGVRGVKAVIEAPVPVRSGLGTSGAVTVAMLGALQAVLQENRDPEDVVRFAHHIEDSLYANTGLQDQASAMYGGAALYQWRYDGTLAFTREPLVDDGATLARHMVVAHTGTPHASTHSGTLVIEAVKHTGRLAPLIEMSEHARAFADAVRSSAFAEAAEAMNREASVRAAFLREFSTQEDEELARLGRDAGCGVRVAGRGSGGAVWAMGPEDGITFLRDAWRNVFAERGAGRVLATAPTMDGLRVSSAG